MHGPSHLLKRGEDPAELIGRGFLVGPADELSQPAASDLPRRCAAVAAFQSANDLAEDRSANANLSPSPPSRFDAILDVSAAGKGSRTPVRCQEGSGAPWLPPSNCLRTASMLNRRIFSRQACCSASLAAFCGTGGMDRRSWIHRSIDSASSLCSSSLMKSTPGENSS